MRPGESFVQQPVRSLQTMLRVLSRDNSKYPRVIPDGIYGPGTMNAVSVFQRIHALPITGSADKITWDAIAASYTEALIRADSSESVEVSINPGKVYRYGDSSPYILLLQSMLETLSRYHTAIESPGQSGILDCPTQQAVSAFQELAGLPITGDADRNTWKQISLHFSLAAHHAEQQLSQNETV